MSYISTKAITTFCAAVGIALVGCGDVPRSQNSTQVSTGNEAPRAESPEGEKKLALTYVTCRARFTSLVRDHPWFDDSDAGHDDGKAPLASFVLVEPAAYANRAIGILFKSANAGTTSSPDQADIGSQFTFQIPADFFSGNHTTIDAIDVRRFRTAEP